MNVAKTSYVSCLSTASECCLSSRPSPSIMLQVQHGTAQAGATAVASSPADVTLQPMFADPQFADCLNLNEMTLLTLGIQSLQKDSSFLLALPLEEVSSTLSAAKPWLLNAPLQHLSLPRQLGADHTGSMPGASEIRDGDMGS